MRARATPAMWLAESAHATIRLSEEDPWRYVTLLAGPAAVMLTVTKLLKYSVSLAAGSRETSAAVGGALGALGEHGPMPLLLLLAALLVGALLQIRFAHLGSIFIPAVVAICALGGSSFVAILDNPPPWASLGFIDVLRSDLLLCLSASAVGASVLFATSVLRRSTLVLFHLLFILVSTIAIIDTGYFLKTGSLADTYLLWYAFSNIGDLRHVLINEVSVGTVLLLSAPTLFSFLPVVVANRRATNRVDLHRATPSWRLKRGYTLTLLAGGALLLTPRTPVAPTAELLRPTAAQSVFGFFTTRGTVDVTVEKPGIEVTSRYRWEAVDTPPRRNVLLIILESARARPFGYDGEVGDARTVTPFLDSLINVEAGSRDMSAVVPHTNKALVSILCGVPPPLNQGRSQVAVSSCLPDLLADHGYRSGFFTPAQLAFEGKGDMLRAMGFGEVYGDEDWPPGDFARLNYFGREDRIILEPVLAWMEDRVAADESFLASVLTLASHHDYGLPPGYPQRDYVADPEYNRYLNTLRYQDDLLRAMIGAMAHRLLLDDTIVVILGDHGEAFAEHGLRYHSGVTYQEGLLVPLVIMAPEDPLPEIRDEAHSQLDVLPTIADLLGMRQEGGRLPGRSVFGRSVARPGSSATGSGEPDEPASETERTVVARPDSDSARTLYAASWLENQSMSMRKGNRKYVYHFRHRPIEMFDLATDPGEKTDLASTLSEAERGAIEQELLAWRASVNEYHARERHANAGIVRQD